MEELPEGVSEFLFCQRHPPALPGPLDGWPAVSPGECCGEWCGTATPYDEEDEDDTIEVEALLAPITQRLNTLNSKLDTIHHLLTSHSL